MALKRCKTSFVTAEDGRKRMVRASEIVDESDPVVKKYPQFFEDVAVTNKPGRREVSRVSRSAVVEQATAEPGEKRRGPGRPPKVRDENKEE